ncbi:hypothetical protein Tco_1402397, partial [Tanacetum coccineum]
VIHTIEIDMVTLVVEIKSSEMSSDKLDKETGSSDGLQPKQADLSCVHALNGLHSHEIRVVPNVIFDLNVALRMFTRRVVDQKRVEDLQLGVESYQKKLNITSPKTFRSDISDMTPYIAYNNP